MEKLNKRGASAVMAQRTETVMLVDGMALLFRAYYATSSGGYIMRTKDGLPTNAVYGFIKYFWDAIKTFRPTHLICCWDMGGRTFRTEQYANYKANRPEAPEPLIPQFDLAKEVMSCFGVPNVGMEGYEADDCIGTLAGTYSAQAKVQILTGDHDMLQLINEWTEVIMMKKGQANYKVYNVHALVEEKKLNPEQIVDFKGLTGDVSDNYPGVKGIGEKTALQLIREYGSIEGILQSLHLLPKAVRGKIEADREMLHLSRDLARIRCDVPIFYAMDDCRLSIDAEKVRRKFEELEFRSLLKMIG